MFTHIKEINTLKSKECYNYNDSTCIYMYIKSFKRKKRNIKPTELLQLFTSKNMDTKRRKYRNPVRSDRMSPKTARSILKTVVRREKINSSVSFDDLFCK